MRKLAALLIVVAASPLTALGAEWNNVPMVDTMCQGKVKGDPDKHPASCALKCADSGYQIRTDAGWLKLDAAGNQLAVAELKATKRKDKVRVNVSGEQKGDVVAVTSLKMAD